MNNVTVVIVEDESLIAHDMALLIEDFGFGVVEICTTGEEAIECIIDDDKNPSVIIMDINLGRGINGIETIRRIKKSKDIPVIYLTAYSNDETIQQAVDTSPSGYLTKPFDKLELLAAIKIALHQYSDQTVRGDIIFDDEFSYDTKGTQLIHNGEYIHLTKQETQLLELFIHRKNQIVPFDVIELELWPDKEPNENTRRALIGRLRTKLNYKFIESIVSMGYRFRL